MSYAARSAAAHSAVGRPADLRYSGASSPSIPSSVYHNRNQNSDQMSTTSSLGGATTTTTPRYPLPKQQPPPPQYQQQASPEAQSRLLSDCTRRVEEQSYYMRQAMDEDNLGTALDHANQMLAELGPGSHSPGSSSSTGSGQGGGGGGISSHGSSKYGSHKLTPRNYYELYMKALEEMPHLEEFFLHMMQKEDDTDSTNNSNSTNHATTTPLYDLVQFCPRVVPRLYLQICAGAASLRHEGTGNRNTNATTTSTVTCLELLRDLMGAVKSVQSPLRGLFLRNYLLQIVRHRLPDQPRESVQEACALLLQNFVDMNRLWVRIQHLPSDHTGTANSHRGLQHRQQPKSGRPNKQERRRREKERNELRLLVGTNLVRLSELSEVVPPETYAKDILPKILEEIATCHDALAQAYLMDCVIQVFPDEYHMVTMRQFLEVCPKLKEKVNLRTILQALMERLIKYAEDENKDDHQNSNKNGELQTNNATTKNRITIPLDTFALLSECIERVAQTRVKQQTASMQDQDNSTINNKTAPPPNHSEIIHLFTQLLNFSLKCYPTETQHMSRCLQVCAETLNVFVAVGPPLSEQSLQDLEALLNIPLLHTGPLEVLALQDFPTLLEFLPSPRRRLVATGLVRTVLRSSNSNSNTWELTQVHALLGTISILWKDDAVIAESENPSIRHSQLVLVARLLHSFTHEDTDETYKMMNLCRRHLLEGSGTQCQTITLPSLLFATMPLLRRVFVLEYGAVVAEQPAAVETPPVKEEEKEGEEVKQEEENEKEEVKQEEEKEEKEVKQEAEKEGEEVKQEDEKEGKEIKQAKEEVEVKEDDDNKKEKEEEKEEDENENAELSPDAKEQDATKGEDEPETNGDQKDDDEEVAVVVDDAVVVDYTTTDAEVKEDISVLTPSVPPPPDAPPPPLATVFSPPDMPPPPPPPKPVFDKQVTCRKLFLFLQKLVATISTLDSELSFRLYLQLATVASTCAKQTQHHDDTDFHAMAYEFMVQAFAIYEDAITDTKSQYHAVTALCGTISNICPNIDKPDYEALVTKTAQFAAKLLKKPDQCKMVTLVSHLFYTGESDSDPNAYRHPQRVLECLQRSLKIADACSMISSANVYLFIDILDHYVFYFEKENPLITDKFVSGLIALINEHLSSPSVDDHIIEAKAYYRQILRYVMQKKDAGGRFANIMC